MPLQPATLLVRLAVTVQIGRGRPRPLLADPYASANVRNHTFQGAITGPIPVACLSLARQRCTLAVLTPAVRTTLARKNAELTDGLEGTASLRTPRRRRAADRLARAHVIFVARLPERTRAHAGRRVRRPVAAGEPAAGRRAVRVAEGADGRRRAAGPERALVLGAGGPCLAVQGGVAAAAGRDGREAGVVVVVRLGTTDVRGGRAGAVGGEVRVAGLEPVPSGC